MSRSSSQKLRADRALRDAALSLVRTDLSNLKADLSRKGLAERSVDRIRDGATGVYEEAVEVAADHKGVLAALVAAIGLWLARHPIIAALTGDEHEDDADFETDLDDGYYEHHPRG